MQSIFISILNFNSKAFTLSCLESLETISRKDIQLTVLVRDNASEEPLSLEEKEYKNFSLEVFYNKTNKGFAGGHNENIRYALDHGASYLLLLNNDATVTKTTLDQLLASFQRNEKAGAVVPKIYFTKGYEYHKDRYSETELGKVIWYAGGVMDWKNIIGKNRGVDEVDHGQFDKEEKTDLFTGCCVLIKKEVFERIGFFNERYFLYYEDSDFAQRMKKAGFSIIFAPAAVAFHSNASSGGGSGSELQDYYISRNRLLFGMSYAPLRTKAALIRESTRLLFTGRKWQKQGVIDYYKKHFGKGSYPV